MENPESLLKSIRVATAGEALIDLVDRGDGLLEPCAGGAVYNFTRALALQGLGTAYLNPLSRDGFGRRLARGLADSGVLLARAEAIAEPTSLAVVGVDAEGQPAYTFYRQGVADRAIDASTLSAATQSLAGLEVVCTGCLALASADEHRYLPWLKACRARGLTVVVDANLRPAAMPDAEAYRATVRAALALADVIKVSDEDLLALAPGQPDLLLSARELFELGPAQYVALTQGSQGAMLLARDGRRWHALDHAALRIVDTVGAGDCFLAGLVAGLLDNGMRQAENAGLCGAAAQRALVRAVASASYCVQRRGCVPPGRHELECQMQQGTVRVVEQQPALARINK
ncbi:carbohydrate kinase [Caenimonas sp. S4]|nr:carbohydrate kinase [Caenimonas soli]